MIFSTRQSAGISYNLLDKLLSDINPEDPLESDDDVSSDEDLQEGLVFPREQSDGKLKLLEELCTSTTNSTSNKVSTVNTDPNSSSSASSSKSSRGPSSMFPPDYLDKYLKDEGDVDRDEWVKNASEEELQSTYPFFF